MAVIGTCRYCGDPLQWADPRPPGNPLAWRDDPHFYAPKPGPRYDYTLIDTATGSPFCLGPDTWREPGVAIGQYPVHVLTVPQSGGRPD